MLRLPLITSVIVAVACAGCWVQQADSSVPPAACEIALNYAKAFRRETGRQIVIRQRPEPLSPSRKEIDAFLRQNPEYRNDPDLPLTLASADLREVSVVERCPILQSWLTKVGVLYDDQRINEIISQRKWSVDVLALSAPAISKDGSTALIYSSEYSGPLAGALFEVTYAKAASGRWTLTSKKMLAVS